jgi:hypothetical protein
MLARLSIEVFIWNIKLFISKISIWFFRISMSLMNSSLIPTLSSLFHSAVYLNSLLGSVRVFLYLLWIYSVACVSSLISLINFIINFFLIHCLRFPPQCYLNPFLWNCWLLEETYWLIFHGIFFYAGILPMWVRVFVWGFQSSISF